MGKRVVVNKKRVKVLLDFFLKLSTRNIKLATYCEREDPSKAKSVSLESVNTDLKEKHLCDTICCLAGWTVIKFGPKEWKVRPDGVIANKHGFPISIHHEAKRLLISGNVYTSIFEPNCNVRSDRAEILARLRNLLKYGSKSKLIEALD